MRRSGGRPLSKLNPVVSSLVKPSKYRDFLLAELRKAPATASRLSTRLQLDRGGTFHSLRRLERRGLVHSQLFAAHTRHGKPTLLRIYFIAGMADGLPIQASKQDGTLTKRMAEQAIAESIAIHEQWLDAYRQLHKLHAYRRLRRNLTHDTGT